MEQTKRQRGRPRVFAGRLSVHLTDEQLAYVEAEMRRDDRPASWITRQLVGEAIEARRQRKQRR